MKRPKLQSIVLWSRFLQIPLYLGMIVALALFSVQFFHELGKMIHHVELLNESDFILKVLNLIDLLLVANLLVMVIISGYESFIEPILVGNDGQKPGWLGNVDPGTIKIKVATSIVGISSIHLLASFLNMKAFTNDQLLWQTVIHIAFVVSALFLAFIDKMVSAKHA
jgi:uncharacterized protein (TIGR00645 family)